MTLDVLLVWVNWEPNLVLQWKCGDQWKKQPLSQVFEPSHRTHEWMVCSISNRATISKSSTRNRKFLHEKGEHGQHIFENVQEVKQKPIYSISHSVENWTSDSLDTPQRRKVCPDRDLSIMCHLLTSIPQSYIKRSKQSTLQTIFVKIAGRTGNSESRVKRG